MHPHNIVIRALNRTSPKNTFRDFEFSDRRIRMSDALLGDILQKILKPR